MFSCVLHSILCLYVSGSRITHQLPIPQNATIPESEFSEERALNLLYDLTVTIGIRESGSSNNEIKTPSYICSYLSSLQKTAEMNGWFLEWEVQTATGAIGYEFLHHTFTNIYHNITNVVISLTPTQLLTSKHESAGIDAFLVNAHYDSANGSYGTSDDGVGVVVLLKLYLAYRQF